MAIETPPLTTGPSDRPPDGRPPRRWPWAIALVVLGLVAGAIAFVVTEPSRDKVVESSATTAPTVSDAVLIKAYEGAGAATQRAFQNLAIGPDDPALAATMTEPLLNYVRYQITDLHSKGIYYEPGGLTNANFHVVEAGADRAVLRLCETDRSYGYNAKGQRLAAPGMPGVRTAMEAIAVRDSAAGVWKISSRYPKTDGRECDGV
jgi:hypothetical protein